MHPSNTIQSRLSNNQIFLEAKAKLNSKQKEAVDQIYGPVMTVAGPGTGKTQLLALRIGNIILNTDTDIQNILCLTFTDSGAFEMRDRLKKFIGPEAYNAKIYTFHGFCNYVIQENIDAFGGYRNLQLISELEKIDVYREIIDEIPIDSPLKRLKGSIYADTARMKDLFNTMKKEGWTAQDIETYINSLEDFYKQQDANGTYINAVKEKSMVAGRKSTGNDGHIYHKGDLRMDKVHEKVASFEKLLLAAKELETYNNKLKQQERYDFNDMILWVIEAFKKDDNLRAKYQERFQFILVDEYQDTNGSQNELLFLLADNPIDDQPNVFIVGDDDQSIFRFQGANMNNIIDFANKYNPTTIVLENNYRSDQRILDWSKKLIEYNEERLVNEREDLQKLLIESRLPQHRQGKEPVIKTYSNIYQEEVGVIEDILAKHEQGVPLHEIAVIYRNHKNVANIIKNLSQRGIPLNIKRRVDVLKELEIENITMILRYIVEETVKPYSGDIFLFKIMHLEYFEIDPKDIALISIYCSRRTDDQSDDRRWRNVLQNVTLLKEAGIEDVSKIITFSHLMEKWIADLYNVTVQVLFQNIINEGNILETILKSPDKAWRLQLINTFFNFIKDQSAKEEKIDLASIIDMVDKMLENNIEIPYTKVIFAKEGIHFTTAHGSKGLEFKHVYIIKADSKTWVKKKGGFNSFSYPSTMVSSSEKSDIEDDRRLFYVAMTRAKDELCITYSNFDEQEKHLEPCRFIAEIDESVIGQEVEKVSDEKVLEYTAQLLRLETKQSTLIESQVIDRVLQSFRMSATSLNKYLKCPITFYFENILRVPMARVMTNGFGNAIHYALELFFRDLEKDPARKIPAKETLIKHFKSGMNSFHSHFTPTEKELCLHRGSVLLDKYYDQYHSEWSLARKFEPEFDIKTEFNGVPISGKLDRIVFYDDRIEVIDYKTGNRKPPKLKPPTGEEDLGGDYWRQIVFYKMLLQGDKRIALPMLKGYMDFVEPDDKEKFKRDQFEVAPFEIEIVGNQLSDSYQKIKNHEFALGCNDEKCKWCNFVADQS